MAFREESSERDRNLAHRAHSSRGSSGYTDRAQTPRDHQISPRSPPQRSPVSIGSDRGEASSPASASIPIPRLPPSYPPSASAGGATSTSNSAASYTSLTSMHSGQPVRSPSSSSMSSHRSHPYSRRPSYPSASPIDGSHNKDLPRIQLPIPHTAGPLGMSRINSSSTRESADYDRSLSSRPSAHRSLSGESVGRGFSLPPLHTIGRDAHSNSKHGYSSQPSAFAPYPGNPYPSRESGRVSPVGQGLRPSYYDAYPTPTHASPMDYDPYNAAPDHYSRPQQPSHRHSSHHLHQPQHQQAYPPHRNHRPGAPSQQRSDHRRISPHAHEFAEPPSPPLRSLPPEYRQPHPPAHTPQSHAPYYPSPTFNDQGGRSRSQTQPARLDVEEPQSGPGQNRRIAHLMSEQKRRESINSGFNALRTALPNSIPTDSKAIVLRKAVMHIGHLEGLLRKAGVPITGYSNSSNSGNVLTPASWDEEGGQETGEGEGEGDDDDVEMDGDDKRVKWEEKAERRGSEMGSTVRR